jgi:hypothetical protein
MTRGRTFWWLVAFAAVAVWWWMGRSPRVPVSPVSNTPAAPVAPAAAVVTMPTPVAQRIDTIPTAEATPLLAGVRSSLGGRFSHLSVVDSRPTADGGERVVIIRSLVDSVTPYFSIYVVDSAMQSRRRSVESFSGPWPDYAPRLERVTSDSVYLIGTSAAYHRTLSRVYPLKWRPADVRARPASARSSPDCGATVLVDVNARTIGGIWMNQSIEDLKREIGAANVMADLEQRNDSATQAADSEEVEGEGAPQPGYTIKLCGHNIRRSGNGISWTDPAFRTAEGLGVGSTLAAFDTVNGLGEASVEEGSFVRYWPLNGIGHFFVDVSDGCYRFKDEGGLVRHVDVDRSCRATKISMIVFQP